MISHSMYSSATALQFSCKRRGRGCCKINCKLEKLEIWGENGKQEMIDYTFHETNVSRRVLHKQRLDPKPAFHTPVLHTLPSLTQLTTPRRFFQSFSFIAVGCTQIMAGRPTETEPRKSPLGEEFVGLGSRLVIIGPHESSPLSNLVLLFLLPPTFLFV